MMKFSNKISMVVLLCLLIIGLQSGLVYAASPNFMADTPTFVFSDDSSARFNTASDQDVTIYYLVTDTVSPPPLSEEVKTGEDYGGVTIITSGNTPAVIDEMTQVNIIGLEPGSPYNAYFVLENSSHELSEVRMIESFETQVSTYTFTYNGNGNTGGAVPIDGTSYYSADIATVNGNTGNLVRTGYTFAGWNTLADGNGTSYGEDDTFVIGTSNVTLYAHWTSIDYTDASLSGLTISSGLLNPVFQLNERVFTVSVANNISSITVTPVDEDEQQATIKVNGVNATSGQAFPVNLNVGSNTIIVVVMAHDGEATETYTITVTRAASSGGNSRKRTTTPPSVPQEAVAIVVNGKVESAGTETKTTDEDKSVVLVKANSQVIESIIEDAIINDNQTGSNNLIQILVNDTISDVAKVELTGDMIKRFEDNTFDLSIKRDNVEYLIPAGAFTISTVGKDLGVTDTSLIDIIIEVKITKLDASVVKKYNEVAKANGVTFIFPPIAFEIIAKTTKADGATVEVAINKFNNYLERIMEIPPEVDPSKITTGVVFNPDGTYSHVPTEVYQKEGKWYARLKSLTNSHYSVAWNLITVKSVENHWSKDAVNDMASRLVILHAERFNPDKAITRADFTDYIIRALGLYRVGSNNEIKFKDVNTKDEGTQAIRIAHAYYIVTGYPDGTFRPDQMITREEAMVIYQRAMVITKLIGVDQNRYQSYTDYEEVEEWATSYVREVLSAHVFNGTTATTITPKANLTYAEAAQAIKNLLVTSKLINK
ncbi:MAG: hypothetical protein CVU95_09855 [Firmicutes bacterium HGW-Firmicutes-2]|jgi:uncharacterized repeat protein (TIGR02543 family)|nr:MAG: hypothetical protein CVU95_09855 [Firmicutes bacterium HGW-Firmicutes-2]